MTNDRIRLISFVVAVMTTVSLVVTGITIYLLYDAAFAEEQARLVETVKSQARLMEAVARFDASHSARDDPAAAEAATLSQIIDAHEHYEGFGETGEFTLARMEGDLIVFLLSHRHFDLETSKPVPLDSPLAEPMRRALRGQSGTLVGLDYRGARVLAAHEPVAELNLGIVAKIDLAEVRAPFVRAGFIAGLSALLVILLGAALSIRISNPLLRRLQESEARNRVVLASTLDPLVTINAYGVIESASDSVARVFGWTPDELIGEKVDVLIPESYRPKHTDGLARYRHAGATSILGHTREFEAVRKDGTTFPIELSVSEVDVSGSRQPLFTGIIRDISERKRTEEETNLLHTAIQAISEAEDLDSALRVALGKVCETAGLDYAEAWLPSGDATCLVLGSAWHRGTQELVHFRRMSEGMTFARGHGLPGRVWATARPEWIEDLPTIPCDRFIRGGSSETCGLRAALAVPSLCGDEVAAVLVFFLDEPKETDERLVRLVSTTVAPLGVVIQRRRVEDELAQHREHLEELVAGRTAELEAMHEQLRLADRLASIGTLAAGLGHDMNNVLFPVRCRLDALDAAQLSAIAHGHFDSVRKSVDYLQQLADGLHLLALDPEDPQASTEVTDLPSWWKQVGTLLTKGLPKHVTFTTDWADNSPPVAVAPHRLTQAVLNLIVNAGEALGDDGRLRVWSEPFEDRRFVRLGITDNGHGMTPQVKRRALDPFFTTKTRGLGTGLGLSLVHGVVQSVGGSVDIDSAPGKGTTIVLNLPAARDSEEHELLKQIDSNRIAAVSLSDRRTATFVASLLDSAGFCVQHREPDDTRACTVWIAEPTPIALDAARRRRTKPRPCTIVFGQASAEWKDLGATIIEDPADLDALRKTVSRLIGIAP